MQSIASIIAFGCDRSSRGGGRGGTAEEQPSSSIVAELGIDTVSAALGYLDTPSLLRVEITGKGLRAAIDNAWTIIDSNMDESDKADGDTARDRVIRSCAQYRRYLLSKYAERVETLRPSSSPTEPIHQPLTGLDAGENEFYIRFSRAIEGDKGRESMLLLAGGVFRAFVAKHEEGSALAKQGAERREFDLSSCDLSRWPSMHRFAFPNDQPFSSFYGETCSCHLRGLLEDALEDVIITVAVINTKSLERRIFFSHDHFTWNGEYNMETRTLEHWHSGMDLRSWDGTDSEGNGSRPGWHRTADLLFSDNKWCLRIDTFKTE